MDELLSGLSERANGDGAWPIDTRGCPVLLYLGTGTDVFLGAKANELDYAAAAVPVRARLCRVFGSVKPTAINHTNPGNRTSGIRNSACG